MSVNLGFLSENLGIEADVFPRNEDVCFTLDGRLHSVGKHSYGINLIRRRNWFSFPRAFHVGRFCSIADNLNIFLGGNHPMECITTAAFQAKFFPSVDQISEETAAFHESCFSNGDVIIGHDVWIGSFSTIMSGVSVGSGSVVAANSHCVKDVPPYAIVGGNPARIIRYRFSEEIIYRLLQLKWWELDDSVIDSLLSILRDRPNLNTLDQLVEKYSSYTRSNNLSGLTRPGFL
jgi:acetyltransferase-like isoleucine patch superfamily enzyme